LWIGRFAVMAAFLLAGLPTALGSGEGEDDLNEAMRLRITSDGFEEGISAEGLRTLNQVIELLESATEKGLDDENRQFAEQLLAESLLERATALINVVQRRPATDPRMAQLRRMAVSDLRRVLATDAPTPLTRLMLAELLTAPDGDPHEAKRLLNEFLREEDLPPNQRAEALALRARLQSETSKAMADFDEAIALAPEAGNYRLARAVFLRNAGELERALASVEQILEAAPDDPAALVLRGDLQRQSGQLDEALKSYERASQLVPQALEPYQNQGEIYRQQGKFEEAIEQFTKVLQLRPGVLMTLLQRAEAYLYAGKDDDALADVEAVLQQREGLVAAHRLRAQILANKDRLQEAIDEMEKLSTALPEEVDIKMQLGLYYLIDKQPEKAIEAYSAVLKLDDEHAAALRNRGDAYLNLGQHAPAIADFERALLIESEDTGLLNNLAWVLATSPDDPIRDGKRAIQLATKACELTEYKEAHIISTLAAAYAESGDFAQAEKWSQQAVDMKDPLHQDQLKKELESYQQKKPWRERQTLSDPEESAEESADGDSKPAALPADSPDATENAPVDDAPAQSIDF
jgi:tetratricopeptide (TPR) repeat protein